MLERSRAVLDGGIGKQREQDCRTYLMRLTDDNLLLHYRQEAGLIHYKNSTPPPIHWGWDGPFSPIRGTFTGHWLSAASRFVFLYEDELLRVRVGGIVKEIAHCQKENGSGWAFPIPEKYLYWLARGKRTWAPQYVCHKTMMGLFDAYRYAGSLQALEVLRGCADWFIRFTDSVSRDQMSDMMDLEETGGMMELWADLYAVTGDPDHLELMRRYERPRLFDPVFRGEDILTNMHANATIPEIQGAARAYEVTGEERYRRIVENYWKLAIDERGTFVTGGQTCCEIYTPMQKQAARLGEHNQEHCVMYNLMRLAEYLFRWTGEAKYADFWEKALYNGVYAQTFVRETCIEKPETVRETGIVAYYLPMNPGAHKLWGSETSHFWCCHCTAVQANTMLMDNTVYREGDDTVYIAQYQPVTAALSFGGRTVTVTIEEDRRVGPNLASSPQNTRIASRPQDRHWLIRISGGGKGRLKLRRPAWQKGPMTVEIDGTAREAAADEAGFITLPCDFEKVSVHVVLTGGLTAYPLPDDPDRVAFLDGPVALCGLTDEEHTLCGDPEHPESLLAPDYERQWDRWQTAYHTVNQPVNFRFVPLYQVAHETYTLYFPVKKADK